MSISSSFSAIGVWVSRAVLAFLLPLTFLLASAVSALACPDARLSGQVVNLSGDPAQGPQSLSVVAGGYVNLSNCGGLGLGYVNAQPNFDLMIANTGVGRDLEFRVQGGCDTVLLVNDALGNWHFDDDSAGQLNPLVRVVGAAAGNYDVWVGTYGSNTCAATLTMTALGGPAAPPISQGTLFAMPVFNGERVDWCRVWGTDCGQAGADAFCQSQGQGTASTWSYEMANRTLVLGGMQICASQGGCGALLNVVCNGGAAAPPAVQPAPGNLTGYRGQVGQTLSFQITGAAEGAVWGTDIYTDDSSVARAAVHAGVLQVGQTGVVQVTLLPGQQSYQPSSRFGVTSSAYGTWGGSFRFAGAAAVTPPVLPPTLPPTLPPAGSISARLLAVLPNAGADIVGAGESLAGNGETDGLYRVGVTAPGQSVASISVQSTGGSFSVWDTIPGNGYWLGAAAVNGQIVNRSDTSVGFTLGAGEVVIDYYVQQLEGRVGRDPMRMTVTFASGQVATVDIPANVSGILDGGAAPSVVPGGK